MLLAHINPQREGLRHNWRKACAIIALVGGLSLPLAGCADGSARDAARAQRRDAERTAMVAELQVTTSATLLGTPIAEASRVTVLPPALENGGNNATGVPFNPAATVPESGGDSPPIVPVDPSN